MGIGLSTLCVVLESVKLLEDRTCLIHLCGRTRPLRGGIAQVLRIAGVIKQND